MANAAISSSGPAPPLTRANLNPAVVHASYAVRGELVARSEVLRAELAAGVNHPFTTIVGCNIGNPHALGQAPISFFRAVLALTHYPALLDHASATSMFAPDMIARARKYLAAIGGGTGAYTTSQGVHAIREEVAAFLQRRDGVPADANDIFLTDGASGGVKMMLTLLIRGPADGVLTPIPQYPLYSACLTLFNGSCVKYFLDESSSWGLTRSALDAAYASGLASGILPRALVVINPGNPTGQVLSKETMLDVIQFCEEKNLLLMADEVYQTNVYGTVPFNSFKKIVVEASSTVSLVSFHSVSKGFLGECGQRGGFFELVNVHEDAREQLVKLASVSLCANTTGQIMTGLMVNPPVQGEESFATYEAEKDGILASLKRRAILVARELNECTGVECNDVEGALYAFPTITLPAKLVAEAARVDKSPDVVYALALLESTGICVVPGSGFGQKEGTFHFRTTILPSEKEMVGVMKRFNKFHEAYMKKYE